jgi:hypothetical protein
LRTHDLPTHFGAAWGKVRARSDLAFARLIARFVDFYRDALFNPHWGEHVHFGSDNVFELDMVCQGLDSKQAADVWRPFFDWVNASPQDFDVQSTLGTGVWQARSWWDLDGGPWTRDPREGAPRSHGWNRGDQGEIGIFLYGYDSLWLPASLLEDSQRKVLADALFAASRHKLVRLHFGKGLAGSSPEMRAAARDTATNPVMVDAFTLVIIADGEQPPAYPGLTRRAMDLDAARRSAREVDAAAAELRRIAPNAGSYVSESNFFDRTWQNDYWGTNYPRLRAVKQKFDPDGLFIVHHGVGSEDWSADGFTRQIEKS